MNKKQRNIVIALLLFAGLVLINVIAQYMTFKVDLTEDKKYTLSHNTVKIIEDIDKPVFVRVLLEGDFPAGFKRIQNSTEELLQELRAINPMVNYEFYDPNLGSTEEINKRREEWSKSGIVPTNFILKEKNERSEKLIYPYAIISYNNAKKHINLLEEQKPGMRQELVLNNSINLLEYKFSQAIQNIQRERLPIIMFTEGQGELPSDNITSLYRDLLKNYRVGRINLDSTFYIPDEVSVLIVPKPTRPFTEKKKFMLDQYVMRGGKVLWLLDQFHVHLDSMRSSEEAFIPRPTNLNLEDMFFKYGFRVNTDLAMDFQSTRIPLVIGNSGGKPQQELFKWYYFPVVSPSPEHIITKSLDPIALEFASSIDTIKTKFPIKKTPILQSSEYSKYMMSPMRLTFNILRIPFDELNFNQSNLNLGLLLEGQFPSLYENRLTQNMSAGLQGLDREFRPSSDPNRMMVIADGDIIYNRYDPETSEYGDVGHNLFENTVFANKAFILNAIEYLRDPDGVISARNKSIKVRLLNSQKAQKEKIFWQLFNIGLPVLTFILLGVLIQFVKKRRYTKEI